MPRKLRIFLIIFVCLLAIPVLLVLFENWRGKHAWESYKAELQAQGEHLDLPYFIPPKVPDEQNFMLNPLFAPLFDKSSPSDAAPLEHIGPEVTETAKTSIPISKGGWMLGMHHVALAEWQTYYRAELHDVALDKSPGEDVLAALARYDPLFTTLRDAAKTRPLSRAPLSYEKGFAMSLPHYTVMQKLLKILSLRIYAELDLGRTDEAFADLQLGFRLLDAIKGDPLLIAGLVRISWQAMLMQPLWEGIASHQWTDTQLARIEEELRSFDFLADYQSTLRSERASGNFIWALIRSNPMSAASVFAYGDWTGHTMTAATRFFPGLIYQNQLSINRLMQEKILPLADMKTRRFDVREAEKSREFFDNPKNYSPYSYISRVTLPVYPGIIQKYAMTQTYVDEALIACEIERYRLAHKTLPATLDDLHMPDLPHDIVNGQPLHYRVTGDDYLLYSVGWNDTDDDGKVICRPNSTIIDPQQGDWVWSLKPLDK